ncbi:uncharacterized protein EDB93DRAFT_1250875 [Suillus bovinus]|uniref:uncharacterized protein n=1 Tax=Suillus bovinus TaxID=48563 RepID=UPI001B85CCA2|nr:uncharacterized protein EDB93DRAFT_1250875 [Suillus bovinus]KAG2146594.1 hypothetical protein EDB93DRAFT_1250875 [Suillus bovinus]
MSPRSAHPSAHPSRAYWDSKPPSGPPHPHSPAGPPEGGHWRYDPACEQERDAWEYEQEQGARHALPHHMGSNSRPSESP